MNIILLRTIKNLPFFATWILILPNTALSQNINLEQERISQQQEQRQRERAEQERTRQKQAEEQRSNQLGQENSLPITKEGNNTIEDGVCFKIKSIQWSQSKINVPRYLKAEANQLILDDDLNPKCLSLENLVALQRILNNSLIEHGHITSKINLPAQNIASQTLRIDWYPGVISSIDYDKTKGRPLGWLNGLSFTQNGELYNQRNFDQALENLKRLPSQNKASIDLVPGDKVGTTKVQYSIEPLTFRDKLHGSIGIDNSGSDSTGLYQANANITVDSPFFLNDLLTLNYNRNADMTAQNHNTKSSGVYWDTNFGRLGVNVGYTYSTYLRTEPGLNTAYVVTDDTKLEGKSKDLFYGMSYMLYRNSKSKVQVTNKLGHKSSQTYANQTEIPNQTRDYWYYESGINLTHYRANQQYTLAFGTKQSLPSWSTHLGEIYGYPNWNGKWRTYNINASATIPFSIKKTSWKYATSLKIQAGETPLPSSEQFSIGSRYTTRGFDDTVSLSGQDGVLWRNDLSYLYGNNQSQQIYLGLDYGAIRDSSAFASNDHALMGAAIGAKGLFKGISYDIAVGTPIHKPQYSNPSRTSIYSSISWSF